MKFSLYVYVLSHYLLWTLFENLSQTGFSRVQNWNVVIYENNDHKKIFKTFLRLYVKDGLWLYDQVYDNMIIINSFNVDLHKNRCAPRFSVSWNAFLMRKHSGWCVEFALRVIKRSELIGWDDQNPTLWQKVALERPLQPYGRLNPFQLRKTRQKREFIFIFSI